MNRGHHLIFGDFNVVRLASERFGTTFNHASAIAFNRFIRDAQLWDVPLGGHMFTRFNKHGDKLSKLDRFLISESLAPSFQKFTGHVLDSLILDHRPIMLSPLSNDFGPTPFKFYNSWLLDKSLLPALIDFWENYIPLKQDNPVVSFKNKMKALKNADFPADSHLAAWIDRLRVIDFNENVDASQKAKIKWDIEADENSKFFHAIVNQKRRYLSIQGIKVDGIWIDDPSGIKGAFHSFFEKKYQKIDVVKIVNRIPFYKPLTPEQNTLLTSTILETDIKDAIWDCGSDKSPGPDGFTFAFYKEFWNMVKKDILAFVGYFFTTSIIPKGCNTSFITLIPKVPCTMVISDFCPISLIGAQYKIIAKVLANRLARVIDSIISPEQSAFIKQRQILDGPLMVNEVIQWCKRKKSKLMVFKIDFEKAFDTISWDFLFQVMHFMGFNETWIKWISGCLHSASASILINGSPTCEFNIRRGLRQGDPLSPFLFIIAMEGLHVAMEDAMAAGLYNGCKINTVNLSHLFFADDALFIGAWSRSNIVSLTSILDCFHLVSGLKINYHKSNLFGVGVPFDEVISMALITGCNALSPPFNYLGLPIDCNMALVKSWDPIIGKFSKRLTKWKASLLSIGGRTTLISSVLGALGTYFFSLFPMPISVNKKLESIRSNFFWGSDGNIKKIPWISWNSTLTSKDKGGLGIGSLYSLNHALIQKWRWRFLHNPHALWARLIVDIHGPNEDSSSFFSHIKNKGVWSRIVGSINIMHEKGFIPLSSLQRRVNNGISTKFWYDTWVGSSSLKQQFPRLFRLALNKDASVRDCWNNGWHIVWSRNVSYGNTANLLDNFLNLLKNSTLNDSDDAWVWYSGNSSFTVKDARGKIDDVYLPDDGSETRWNRFVPKKVNVFIWRALRDRFPTRWNLSRRGVEIASITCPICDNGIETSYHTLWVCSLATSLWIRVFKWLDFNPPVIPNLRGLFTWIEELHISSNKKAITEVVCSVVLWALWNFRNDMIFGDTHPKCSILYDKVVDFSFRWPETGDVSYASSSVKMLSLLYEIADIYDQNLLSLYIRMEYAEFGGFDGYDTVGWGRDHESDDERFTYAVVFIYHVDRRGRSGIVFEKRRWCEGCGVKALAKKNTPGGRRTTQKDIILYLESDVWDIVVKEENIKRGRESNLGGGRGFMSRTHSTLHGRTGETHN
ncbi:RNA-directed DNA polymerase, eukaryota, reverse transcriptase zinc-binding domain protein [Tanacetum coccineum]